jgi:BASS family bile acid:Na+ symporter
MTLQQAIILALQVSIVLTVFGFGLQTRGADVTAVLRQPSLLGRSLGMFVVMPVVGIGLATTFVLRPSVEIILVALAISPIPPLLPGREQKAGAHSSFGLGLMMIAGLLSIAIVPLMLAMIGWYTGREIAMPPQAIARVVFLAAVLPLGAGMAVLAFATGVAHRICKPVGIVAKVLLLAGVLGLLVGTLPAALALVGNGTLAAMVVFMGAGLAAGHVLGGPVQADRLVLALSTSTRHPAIALAIAKVNFPDDPNLAATIVLYFLVSFAMAIPYQRWQQRRIAASA